MIVPLSNFLHDPKLDPSSTPHSQSHGSLLPSTRRINLPKSAISSAGEDRAVDLFPADLHPTPSFFGLFKISSRRILVNPLKSILVDSPSVSSIPYEYVTLWKIQRDASHWRRDSYLSTQSPAKIKVSSFLFLPSDPASLSASLKSISIKGCVRHSVSCKI